MYEIAFAFLNPARPAQSQPQHMGAHMWTVEVRRSDGTLIEQQAELSDYALRHWLRGYSPRDSEILCLMSDDPYQIADMIRRMSSP
jgi:hypothetical protein